MTKTKSCSKCLAAKPLSAFQRAKGYRDGHAGQCKACRAAYKARYIATNSAKLRESNRRYREENREKVLAAQAAYAASPRGIASKRKPEYRAKAVERANAWQRANPLRHKANMMNTRARAKGVRGRVTAEDITALWIGNNGKCAYCPARATEFDHVIPFARGGKNTPDNVLPCCESCNASKQEFPVFEWLARRVQKERMAAPCW